MALLPSPPARVADLGSGNGYLAGLLSNAGYSVTGVESSADGIEVARAAYPSVRFVHASVYDDLRDRVGVPFDVVLATEVIEHLFDPQRFLSNAYSLLRPGGIAVLSTPYHGYAKNLAMAVAGRWDAHFATHWLGGHIKFFSPRTLQRMLLEVGFVSVRFRFAGRLPLLWKSMVACAARPGESSPEGE